MKDFNRGIIFTVSMIMFGKGMYGLGRLAERKSQSKAWKRVGEISDQISDILTNCEKEEKESQ